MYRALISKEPKPLYGMGALVRVGLSLILRLATHRSDLIDQATIRGYVLIRLRQGEEEEVCTGGRAELYTCWGAKPLAKPLTRPYLGIRLGNKHQRRHNKPRLYYLLTNQSTTSFKKLLLLLPLQVF